MPPAVREGPCAPWTTPDLILGAPRICALDTPPPQEHLEDWAEIASWHLYERTGRRWPGICTSTVEAIEGDGCRCWPFTAGGDWRRAHDVGRCPDPAGPTLRLGYAPIVAITSATSSTAGLLDPGSYYVQDARYLVRRDNQGGWPGDITVVFTHGRAPNRAGVRAATSLAAELLLGSIGAKCRLPERTSSAARQGVTVAWLDPMEFLDKGLTGIFEVDLFLSAGAGPGHRRSRVLDPGNRVRSPHRQ